MTKIKAVKFAQQPSGLAEIEDSSLALRFEHAKNLAQARIIVGKIAKAEGGNYQISAVVGKRQGQSIGFHRLNLLAGKLRAAMGQHGMRKVECNDLYLRTSSAQRHRHVSGPGAQIEHTAVFAR